jgi:tetratricopeptide (TPR) repeat protein
VLAGVALATLIAHAPVLKSQALCLDDNLFLTNNALVRSPGWHSAGRFFGEILAPSTVGGYYTPLSMTSLMLDVAAGGRPDQLGPFHRTALALHIVCTLLVVVLLYQLFHSLWPAALAGLLFGLHPLTVEPVAWIGERKTQLAALGALLAIVLYVRHARRRERPVYLGSLAAFAFALLSKPTSLPLPFLLVLLDLWPLARFGRRALIEKIPFFTLGALSLVITFISHARTASLGVFATYTPFQGILLAFYKLAFYLTKIVWPARLTPVYVPPRPLALGEPVVLGSIALIALLAGAAIVSLRRTRAPAVAGLFYLIAIAPTLGAVQYSWIVVSDKYLYPLPLLALLLLVTHLLTRLWEGPTGAVNDRADTRSAPRAALRPAIAIAVGLLGVAALFSARAQYGHWRTTETLYQHMLRLAPDEALVRSNYALELQQQGRFEDARRALEEALALDPGDARIEANLAGTLVRLGRFDEALPHFAKALETTAEPDVVQSSLGNALVSLGRFDEARAHFDEALRLNPRSADAHTNLGRVQALQGDIDGAIASFTRAVECDPLAYTALGNLGGLLARRGDHAGALRRYEAALRINPRFPEGHANMGVSLAALGRLNDAAAQFREALRLAPGFLQAQRGLGDVYLAQGKLDDAIRAYQAALRINPNDSQAQVKLQAALARRGGTP